MKVEDLTKGLAAIAAGMGFGEVFGFVDEVATASLEQLDEAANKAHKKIHEQRNGIIFNIQDEVIHELGTITFPERPFLHVDYGMVEAAIMSQMPKPEEKAIEGKPRVVEPTLVEHKCYVCKEWVEAGYIHGRCADRIGARDNGTKALPPPPGPDQIWE